MSYLRGCARCDWKVDADTRPEARVQAALHADRAAHPLCELCGRSLPAALDVTCYGCIHRARVRLAEIVELFALLPAELLYGRSLSLLARVPHTDPALLHQQIDVLVMLAPGSTGTAWPEHLQPAPANLGYGETYDYPFELRSPQHGMNLDSDPENPAVVLGQWEDDWRAHRGETERTAPATVAGSANYLMPRLGAAAQQHPAFGDFVDDLRRLHRSLEEATAHGERPERSEAPCFECGQPDLQRAYRPADACDHAPPGRIVLNYLARDGLPLISYDEPVGAYRHRVIRWRELHSCDQGGRTLVWTCRSCGREYEPRDYWLAVRALLEQQSHENRQETAL